MNGKYKLSTIELIFCYSMSFIMFTSGLLLFFGTTGGVEGCNEGTEPQRMWFFTETWVANCSTVQTWYMFGIVSAIVSVIIIIATIVSRFT